MDQVTLKQHYSLIHRVPISGDSGNSGVSMESTPDVSLFLPDPHSQAERLPLRGAAGMKLSYIQFKDKTRLDSPTWRACPAGVSACTSTSAFV